MRRILAATLAVLPLTLCSSCARHEPRAEETHYDPLCLPLPRKSDNPSEYERAQGALVRDLANALLQAIRENDARILRPRIMTGRERYKHELGVRGSLPSISEKGAVWVTGELVHEIEDCVRQIHHYAKSRGIDPMTLRLSSSPELLYDYAHRVVVSLRLRNTSLRIGMVASLRWIGGARAFYVLDGGSIFGGIYHSLLTDKERELLLRWDERKRRGAEEIGRTILANRISNRWMVSAHGCDLMRSKHVDFNHFTTDGYFTLGYEQRQQLKRTIVFSEWQSDHERGDEYMRVFFDDNGLASRVLVDGKELEAPQN